MKIIKINNCRECPYLSVERHYYCGKKYKDNSTAYKDGGYAENQGEIGWLYRNCPLEEIEG